MIKGIIPLEWRLISVKRQYLDKKDPHNYAYFWLWLNWKLSPLLNFVHHNLDKLPGVNGSVTTRSYFFDPQKIPSFSVTWPIISGNLFITIYINTSYWTPSMRLKWLGKSSTLWFLSFFPYRVFLTFSTIGVENYPKNVCRTQGQCRYSRRIDTHCF